MEQGEALMRSSDRAVKTKIIIIVIIKKNTMLARAARATDAQGLLAVFVCSHLDHSF